MKNTLIESVQSAVKNWWVSLIVGILFVLMSFWMMLTPAATFEALVIAFSIVMFASGIFEIAFAVSNSKTMHGWGWYLVMGVIDLLLGSYLLFHPGLLAVLIPFIIGLWLMFRGFSAIGLSIDAQRMGVKQWGWSLVMGILTVICSVLVIWNPFTGIVLAVWMAALSFLFIGIYRILFSVGLRKIGKKLDRQK